MAKKTIRVSDVSGDEIPEGKGATVRITFADARKGVRELDVTDAEAEKLGGRQVARRGRRPLGDSDFLVHATASSRLPVSLTVAGGNCIITGRTVHLTAAGSCSITASQNGNSSYNLATSVSRTFLIEDVAARSVRALATSGTRGASVNLPFRVGPGNGDVRVKITVQKNRTTVARLARNFFRVESGHVYALPWQASESKTTALYRFCVTLSDRAGRETAPSCGRIRLR